MPENTVLAFANAVRLGAEMVEMDVKRCKTGELLVLHDGTVDRTTNGKGSDWVNCMVYVALRLEFLADVLDSR